MNDPERLPDSHPAVVCDMSHAPDTPEERVAEYQRLFSGFLIGRDRVGDGFRFRFRADEGIADWVRDLASREQECCAFFDFAVTGDDSEVHWDVSVIDDDMARQVLDEFYRLPEILAEVDARAATRHIDS
jgi:hypothetical protein